MDGSVVFARLLVLGSTVFAGLTTVTDSPTGIDRQTDRPHYSICNIGSTAMRPNN